MKIDRLKEILAQVLYLDSPSDIDPEVSIFNDYDMNSIDLIDFVYEIKNEEGLDVPDGSFWPINEYLSDPQLYDSQNLEWTEDGLNKLSEVFGNQVSDKKATGIDLYKYFTLNYVLYRIDFLKNNS